MTDIGARVTWTMVCAVVTMAAAAPPAATDPTFPPPGKLIDVGGYRLHLNCSGAGAATVVLIAGAGDFSFDWSLVQPIVSRLTRVCSYDRAGTAWSDPGPTPRTMRQDAFELRSLLRRADVQGPYVLVGHSLGGLIARVFADQYSSDVAGMVLIDPTHEDTVLGYQGKLVRIRESAKGVAIPPTQTMQSSPPLPPTAADVEQFEFNQKIFGPPRIVPPFNKLPQSIQAMRVAFLSRPPRATAGRDYWAEELQQMHKARARAAYQLGTTPLVVLIPKHGPSDPPPGVSAEQWQGVVEEKRQQKLGLVDLSHNSKLMIAEESGHHIQLDEPNLVRDAIGSVLAAVACRCKLAL